MSRSWTIGAAADCDLVVGLPTVSGRHCRLTRDEDGGYILEDLNSTNGTFVNGVRVREPVVVAPGDAITLGLTAAMPWPADAARALIATVPAAQEPPPGDATPTQTPTLHFHGETMVVGRIAGCDLVLDLPSVSGRHARLSRSGDRILIEDLGSSNGTFVNGERIAGQAVVQPGDRINLGRHALVLAVEPVAAAVAPVGIVADLPGLVREPAPSIPIARRLAGLAALAPLVAVLIAMTAGSNVQATLGWLAAAAVWYGLANAALAGLLDAPRLREGLTPSGAGDLAARLAVLGGLGLWQCAFTWLALANVVGLKAPGLAAIALLSLASAVGLAIGLLIVAAAPRPAIAQASIAAVVVLVAWVGVSGSWSRPAAALVPSRWAFEGLLLLETDRRPVTADADLAEPAFPAETHRMGLRADVTALGAMLIGLGAAAAFIATASASPSPAAAPPPARMQPTAS